MAVLLHAAYLLVLSLSVAAAQTPEPPEVSSKRSQTLLESAARGLESISSMEAAFTQYAPSGQISKGRFYLSRPGRLRFEFDPPNPMLIVATGGMVYIHDSELETTETYPVNSTPLRFLLTKELDLTAAQVLSVREDQHGIKIELAAKDEELQGRLALLFESDAMTLAGWSFIDPNGSITAVNLENVEEKRRLPGSLFRIPNADGLFLSDN